MTIQGGQTVTRYARDCNDVPLRPGDPVTGPILVRERRTGMMGGYVRHSTRQLLGTVIAVRHEQPRVLAWFPRPTRRWTGSLRHG